MQNGFCIRNTFFEIVNIVSQSPFSQTSSVESRADDLVCAIIASRSECFIRKHENSVSTIHSVFCNHWIVQKAWIKERGTNPRCGPCWVLEKVPQTIYINKSKIKSTVTAIAAAGTLLSRFSHVSFFTSSFPFFSNEYITHKYTRLKK